ncbi:MAG: class I SAM-dependent methyltransferase [Synergistaceae bacterium]|nr:class I SAM-dependent methyltransferase [Synergistaceae bacterium]
MLKRLLKFHFNAANETSVAHKFRMKRMRFFEERFSETFGREISEGKTLKVLDVGGTLKFWKSMHSKYFDTMELTLLNLNRIDVPEEYTNVKSVAGDARDLSCYQDKEFDLVFSNSVIEHVGKERDQKRMASEILRVGKHCYVQTPNRNFPVEPHFIFPMFQFLPLSVRAFLVRHFALGWRTKAADSEEEAREIADSVNLLNEKQLRKLFPGAEIQREKFLLLTKSFYFFI